MLLSIATKMILRQHVSITLYTSHLTLGCAKTQSRHIIGGARGGARVAVADEGGERGSEEEIFRVAGEKVKRC